MKFYFKFIILAKSEYILIPRFSKDVKQQEVFRTADESIDRDNQFQKQFHDM